MSGRSCGQLCDSQSVRFHLSNASHRRVQQVAPRVSHFLRIPFPYPATYRLRTRTKLMSGTRTTGGSSGRWRSPPGATLRSPHRAISSFGGFCLRATRKGLRSIRVVHLSLNPAVVVLFLATPAVWPEIRCLLSYPVRMYVFSHA